MKTNDMFRRVENISEKLNDPTTHNLLRVDLNSLSEAEKALFRKVDEISEEYQRTGNPELLVKNDDLIYKNIEIIYKRVTELYCGIIPLFICGATALNYEVVKSFFQLHFLNFEADLFECVRNLQRWEERDIQEFLCEIKSRPFLIRIPRGFNEYNSKISKTAGNSKEAQKTEDKKPESPQPPSVR